MKSVYFSLLSFLCIIAGYAQTEKKLNANEKDSIGRIERFYFEYAEKLHKKADGLYDFKCDVWDEHGYGKYEFERGGWYVCLLLIDWPQIQEYAPANDNVYYIEKDFYPNGMIQNRGKQLGSVQFGLWEYFNRYGKLVKVVDGDAKFGEIKWYDVVALLEKEGWFNRQTGEINIRGTHVKSPIKPDGKFTYDINYHIDFFFFLAEIKNGREVKPPMWKAIIYESKADMKTIYEINGHTGEYTKKQEHIQYED